MISPLNNSVSSPVPGFLVAGGLATTCHWFIMAALMAGGLVPAMATTIGSLSGAAANYQLQRRLAFINANSDKLMVWRYVASCIVAGLCNLVVFYLFNNLLRLPLVLSQMVTTGVVATLNYIVYQRLVFHEKRL